MHPASASRRAAAEGKIQGGAIFGRMKRQSDSSAPVGLLGLGSGDGEKTVMHFNEDCSEISVMERADSRSPTFYTLERLPLKKALPAAPDQ